MPSRLACYRGRKERRRRARRLCSIRASVGNTAPSIDWVGRIVESISGEPLDVYFRKHIFDPLGMNDTAFVISPQQREREASVHRRGPNGSLQPQPMERQSTRQSFSGGGGIYSTAPDYLTFIRMLLRGGSLDGVRILRPDTVALMGQNQIGEIEAGVLKTTVPALSNDVNFFPGISLQMGLRSHDQHAGRSERPQCRQPDLGRPSQHLLLDRSWQHVSRPFS